MNGFNGRLISIYVIISVVVFQQGVDFQMMMFMYYPPQHFCQPPNATDVSVNKDNCYYSIGRNDSRSIYRCQAWTFDNSQVESTFVTDFSLVCQHQYLQLLILPLRNLATGFNLLLAFFSDVKGRKTMLLLSLCLDSALWILLGLLPLSYVLHVFVRCLKIFASASSMIGFVLISEITPLNNRNLIIINYWVPFGLGTAVAPFYLWLTRNWRSAYLISAIPCICYIAAPFIILESPKWLKAHERREEAIEVLNKLNDNLDVGKSHQPLEEKNHEDESDFCKELWLMMSSCTMVIRYLTLLVSSFAFFFVYQGISTNLKFGSSNIYINALVLGLVEVPAGFLAYLSSKYIGNVKSMVFGISMTILFYSLNTVLVVSFPNSNLVAAIFKLVFACFVRFMISSSWNIQGVFYVVLLPTTIRNFLCNFGDLFGIIGGALGGFFGYYIESRYIVANIVFDGVLLLSMILLALFIPSCKDQELPQNVDEAKMIKKDEVCH